MKPVKWIADRRDALTQAVCLLFPAEYVYDDVMEAGKGCGGCMGCPGTSENLG